MENKTDWVGIKLNGDRYRMAVRASNSNNTQGYIIVEKYIGHMLDTTDYSENVDQSEWVRIGWNGILNLFTKLSQQEVSDEN